MTDKRQQAKWIYNKTVNTWGIYSSLEEAFEFCFSSFANEHNTLPKSTRGNEKLNKFAFGTAWLPDLSSKHWFTSSVWNFCRWVADVPPRETTLSGDERGETSAVRKLVFFMVIIIGPFAIRYVSQVNFGDGGGGGEGVPIQKWRGWSSSSLGEEVADFGLT